MSYHAILWLRPSKSFPCTWTKFPPQPGRLYITCPWDLWDLSLYHLPPHSLGFNLSGLLFLPQAHQGHVYLRFYTVSPLPQVLFPYNLHICIISDFSLNTRGLPWWLNGKDSCLPMQETWVWSLGWEDPLEKEMATHSSILAWGESHEQRSPAGYSPWGCKESSMT